MEETTETKQGIIVRTVSRLLKLMGVSFPRDTPVPKPIHNNKITDFTYKELRHIAGFNKNYDNMSLDTGNISDYIKGISQKSRAWSKEIKNLKIMAPEINRARDTVVSTILSPTDLQTDNISIVVSNTGLGEQLESELSAELQSFFNKEFKLSNKASKWIGEALFETGAAAILVLPEKNIDILNTAIDLDYLKSGVDPNDYIIQDNLPKKPADHIKFSSEQLTASCEALISYETEDLEVFIDKISSEYLDKLISETPSIALENMSIIKNNVKSTAEQIAELINNNKKHVMFTSDPTLLNTTATRLNTTVGKLTKKIENNFLFNSYSPTFLLDTRSSHGKDEMAVTIKIPYHAVIPVTVPNSPDTHIGYFIIVDEWGTPLNEDYYDSTASGGGKKMSEAGSQAVLGRPNSTMLNNLVTETSEFEAATSIFGIMLRHMMDNKLNEFGLAGASVSYKEAVSASLFRQLLHKKRVGIVFVPEPLMVYLCYDYNENGTGKSCIQDHDIIIALRNILIIAGVMSAAENSIDKKKIEVAVDEKNANIEQTLNMVRNAFIEKNMLRFDNNPHTIQRDLIQKSMTIYPKGVRGLQDALNVAIDRGQTNSVEPNSELITKLTEMLIMNLIAPASALNKTGEDEYSRSVATTNLFFNNQIRDLQNITTEDLTKFVKLYAYYSSIIRKKIYDILKTSEAIRTTKRKVEYKSSMQDLSMDETEEDSSKDEDIREHTLLKPQVKEDIKTNTDPIDANVMKVINNISVKLPVPRIVVDKAHFEEIQGYIGTLDTILQSVYADEMSMELETYAKPLKLLRAIVKDEMIREYVKSIGFQSSYNLPPLSEISSSNIEENILHLINVAKGILDVDKHIGKVVLPEQDSGFGGSSFGGESSFGGDSGFGEDEASGGEEHRFDDEPGGGDQLESEPEEQEETEREEPSETQSTDTSPPGGSLT